MEELEIYKGYVELVEQELYSFLKRFNGPSNYYDYLLYHFGFKSFESNGNGNTVGRLLSKRLRPVMSLLIYRAILGEEKDFELVMPLVLSAEIMHNASLVHDDIQDHDELRWGRPTVWKMIGIEQAINCGDTLQALSYQAILELKDRGVGDSMIAKLIAVSNRVHVVVVEGQYMDLLFEKRLDISEFEYFEMISKKTATPYSGVAESAAMLATQNKNQELINAYKNFALKFGMLFQLTDDILGIWGDVQKTGKIPADIRSKKKTLPIIYALNRATKENRDRLIDLYTGSEPLDEPSAAVVAKILDECGAIDSCMNWLHRYYDETLALLRQTNLQNSFQEKLEYMTNYCFKRTQVFSEKK